MSYYADKLDTFVDLATSVPDEYPYWDASDVDNIRAAEKFFHQELGFLRNGDKKELKVIWDAVVSDCRDIKLLFNAIKVLKDKYDQPIYEINRYSPY